MQLGNCATCLDQNDSAQGDDNGNENQKAQTLQVALEVMHALHKQRMEVSHELETQCHTQVDAAYSESAG